MIMWLGYTFNEDLNVWTHVNGTPLDFDNHYFGLKGSEGEGRNLDIIHNEGTVINKKYI